MTREASHGAKGRSRVAEGRLRCGARRRIGRATLRWAALLIDPSGSKTDSALAPFPSQSDGTAPP